MPHPCLGPSAATPEYSGTTARDTGLGHHRPFLKTNGSTGGVQRTRSRTGLRIPAPPPARFVTLGRCLSILASSEVEWGRSAGVKRGFSMLIQVQHSEQCPAQGKGQSVLYDQENNTGNKDMRSPQPLRKPVPSLVILLPSLNLSVLIHLSGPYERSRERKQVKASASPNTQV